MNKKCKIHLEKCIFPNDIPKFWCKMEFYSKKIIINKTYTTGKSQHILFNTDVDKLLGICIKFKIDWINHFTIKILNDEAVCLEHKKTTIPYFSVNFFYLFSQYNLWPFLCIFYAYLISDCLENSIILFYRSISHKIE